MDEVGFSREGSPAAVESILESGLVLRPLKAFALQLVGLTLPELVRS